MPPALPAGGRGRRPTHRIALPPLVCYSHCHREGRYQAAASLLNNLGLSSELVVAWQERTTRDSRILVSPWARNGTQ